MDLSQDKFVSLEKTPSCERRVSSTSSSSTRSRSLIRKVLCVVVMVSSIHCLYFGGTSKETKSLTFVSAQLTNAATMANDVRLRRFVNLLDRAGISPSIGTIVFAPSATGWNAFEAADQTRWDRWLNQPEFFLHFQHLLLWHFSTEGPFRADQIWDGQRTTLTTTNGDITVVQAQPQRIDNVLRTSFPPPWDTATAEGILHVIDDVIMPPYLTQGIMWNLENDRSGTFIFSFMVNLAIHAELDDEIDQMYDNGITLLVPPNRRFNRVEIDVDELLLPENKEYTRSLVLCHMIERNYDVARVFALNQENNRQQFVVNSMYGTSMWITTTEDKVRFQSADIIFADQPANNGVWHAIDFPLTPPGASDIAQFTAISTSFNTEECWEFFNEALLTSQDIAEQYGTSITLWCPTEQAFDFFNPEDFNRLLQPNWVRHATEFLLSHMSAPGLTRAEWLAMAPGTITMLSGEVHELRRSGTIPRIRSQSTNDARAQFGDLRSVDGYLHIVDEVIMPTAVSQSIYNKIELNPDTTYMAGRFDFVDLTNTIDQDLPLTVLVPFNQAFDRVEILVNDLPDILKRHVFGGLLFSDVIRGRTTITSVSGVTFDVETRGPNNEYLYIGDAYVYQSDILARNGVIHYIDRVLGEVYPTNPPSISPQPTITASPTKLIPPTPAPVPIFTPPTPIALPPESRPSENDGNGGGNNNPTSAGVAVTTSSTISVMIILTTMLLSIFFR